MSYFSCIYRRIHKLYDFCCAVRNDMIFDKWEKLCREKNVNMPACKHINDCSNVIGWWIMMEFVQRLVYLIWKRFSIQCMLLTQRPCITFKRTFLDRHFSDQYWRYSLCYECFGYFLELIFIALDFCSHIVTMSICKYFLLDNYRFMQPLLAISYEMAWPHMNNEALVVIYGMKQILLNVTCKKYALVVLMS